jgi:GH35 family endo-1,4-beta-xylanase
LFIPVICHPLEKERSIIRVFHRQLASIVGDATYRLHQSSSSTGETFVAAMAGFTDKSSWIPIFFKGSGAALIFDEEYKPKPAYETLREELWKAK